MVVLWVVKRGLWELWGDGEWGCLCLVASNLLPESLQLRNFLEVFFVDGQQLGEWQWWLAKLGV